MRAPAGKHVRRLLLAFALALASGGCSAMIFLDSGEGEFGDVGGASVDQRHVFSKSVSRLGASGEAEETVEEVVRGDRYRVSVTLAWQNAGGPGTVRRTWQFVRDGEVYGERTDEIHLDRSPFVLELDADSAQKPPGRYEYLLYVDDRLLTRIDVVVVEPSAARRTDPSAFE